MPCALRCDADPPGQTKWCQVPPFEKGLHTQYVDLYLVRHRSGARFRTRKPTPRGYFGSGVFQCMRKCLVHKTGAAGAPQPKGNSALSGRPYQQNHDDDETFRKVLQHKARPLTLETQTTFRNYQADPGCIHVKPTVYKRGNPFTRTCRLDSKPAVWLEGKRTALMIKKKSWQQLYTSSHVVCPTKRCCHPFIRNHKQRLHVSTFQEEMSSLSVPYRAHVCHHILSEWLPKNIMNHIHFSRASDTISLCNKA